MFGPIEQVKTWAIIGLAIALGVAMLTATIGIHYYRSEYIVAKAEFDAFKSKVSELGEAAKSRNLLQEKYDADRLGRANTERDDALNKLRIAEASARSRAATNNPRAPAGSSQVCFTASGYDAAFKRFGADLDKFIQDARGIAGEGDRAAIDVTTLIKSWPTAQPAK